MIPVAITVIVAAIAVVVTILIAVPLAGKTAVAKKVREDSEKIGTAEEKARNIIDEAIKSAEAKKREALVEAKEESLKLKNEHDREYRDRRAELQKYEKRVLSKEESVDKKAESLERRENHLAARETELKKKEKHVDELQEQRVQELERISGLTSEEAKDFLLKSVEEDVKDDTARLYKDLVSKAKKKEEKTESEGEGRSGPEGAGICRHRDSEVCGGPCFRDNDFCRTASE